jgi:Ca2+-binding EF-hand superfamily protein
MDAFRGLFLHFDAAGRGALTLAQVGAALAAAGERGTPARVAELSTAERRPGADQPDGSGDVDFAEFCEVCVLFISKGSFGGFAGRGFSCGCRGCPHFFFC